jgi:death-on-curing protein
MENPRKCMRYLTIEEILEVAEGHVSDYQVLREEQLRYLVEVVGWKIGDTELYPTLPQKAAVYAHHIITGHIFLDGNKRIGLNCAILFLEFNGCTLRLDIDDSIIELGLKVADGSITALEVIADHIQSWIL